jgi:hypothetical protein
LLAQHKDRSNTRQRRTLHPDKLIGDTHKQVLGGSEVCGAFKPNYRAAIQKGSRADHWRRPPVLRAVRETLKVYRPREGTILRAIETSHELPQRIKCGAHGAKKELRET